MAYRWLGILLISTVWLAGCGAEGPGDSRCLGGGCAGSGGAGGIGGVAGGGGSGGAGGMAGTGGTRIQCATSLLCISCPATDPCVTNADCSSGSICAESGCDDLDGAPIKQCFFAGGGACNATEDCPSGRECMDVPEEGMRCVRTAPGCDTSFDCPLGFACESSTCVDRRIPCELDEHCPKNHLCGSGPNSRFCRRIQIDCLFDFDCEGLAQSCEDIDGDGNKECAGVRDPNAQSLDTCLNSQCGDPSAPVCEASSFASTSNCGQYGLCLSDGDCATGFRCAALWQDGRKECVPEGGSCSSYAHCPGREVCASAREGGAPSCQKGYQP